MSLCCPPGRGCNASSGGEPCVLELCRRLAGREATAAAAVGRWEQLERATAASSSKRELRFRRRAYERATERALVALLMRAHATDTRPRARPPEGAPMRRLGVLLGHPGRRRR